MLVLARKPGQVVSIQGGINIMVLSVHGETVRLGIEAPRDVSVDREEVARAKEISRRLAAGERACDLEMEFDQRENQRCR